MAGLDPGIHVMLAIPVISVDSRAWPTAVRLSLTIPLTAAFALNRRPKNRL
jgi:hypothetical protein